MASKYQREHDMYCGADVSAVEEALLAELEGYERSGNKDRAAQVVAAAKAEGDPVAEPAKADKPARKRAEKVDD